MYCRQMELDGGTISCKMHEEESILHFKTLKEFYDNHRGRFVTGNFIEVQRAFKDDANAALPLLCCSIILRAFLLPCSRVSWTKVL